nr:immunoglobulin light chain junction region [Macaca mulatta]
DYSCQVYDSNTYYIF